MANLVSELEALKKECPMRKSHVRELDKNGLFLIDIQNCCIIHQCMAFKEVEGEDSHIRFYCGWTQGG